MTDTTTAVRAASDEEIEALRLRHVEDRYDDGTPMCGDPDCQSPSYPCLEQRLIARIDALKAELAESWDARRGLLVDVASITAERDEAQGDVAERDATIARLREALEQEVQRGDQHYALVCEGADAQAMACRQQERWEDSRE